MIRCQRFYQPLYLPYNKATYYEGTKTISNIYELYPSMRTNPSLINPENLWYVSFPGGTWLKTNKDPAYTIRYGGGIPSGGKLIVITYYLPDSFSSDISKAEITCGTTAGIMSPLWLSADL